MCREVVEGAERFLNLFQSPRQPHDSLSLTGKDGSKKIKGIPYLFGAYTDLMSSLGRQLFQMTPRFVDLLQPSPQLIRGILLDCHFGATRISVRAFNPLQ